MNFEFSYIFALDLNLILLGFLLNSNSSSIFIIDSIERDAQLLANRIALLKQEEMKTWKKIEETKKRANDVHHLKRKNEERQQKKMAFEIQE